MGLARAMRMDYIHGRNSQRRRLIIRFYKHIHTAGEGVKAKTFFGGHHDTVRQA